MNGWQSKIFKWKKISIQHSDNLKNCQKHILLLEKRRAIKECKLQARGWVCLRINLVGCLERGWPSRNHSEGLTSHRSYGRTGLRRNGPAASIEWKVSWKTSAKDHEGCISHHMLTWHKFNQKLTGFHFCRRRQKEPNAGCWVSLLVSEHQRGSPPVPSDQPVHQPVQLEPLPAVPRTTARQWGRTSGSS